MKYLKTGLMSMIMIVALVSSSISAQGNGCTTSNGVTISVKPEAPLQFQFFPVSLLGIGGGEMNVSAFQNFGLQFMNNSGSEQRVDLQIALFNGGQNIFSRNMSITVTVPAGGPYFVGTPQLLNTNLTGAVRRYGSATKPNISQDFLNSLKGGLPSGTFIFTVSAGADGDVAGLQSCGQITVEILTGATVDIVLPADGSEVSSLPQFQWTAVGGRKFKLTAAKLKAGQTGEDALNNSSQRFVLEMTGTSYQTISGGPANTGIVRVLENNLTWSPGLAGGEYVYRVTMVQEDPITGTQNLVNSKVGKFIVVGGGMANTSGLNTKEIVGLLQSAAKGVDIEALLKGFEATSIKINGNAATVDELRAKLADLPAAVKWEVKP